MLDPAAQSFLADPGAWADPGLAASLIAPGLQPETAQRFFASPRLAARASQWLAGQLGAGDPATLDPADLALASASGAMLAAIALRAGAVWHAGRVCALVLGADIAALSTRVGEETRHAALRYAALAPAGQCEPAVTVMPQQAPGADDSGALADAIQHDGARCVSAWIDALPAWAASRVRLKWQGGSASPACPDGCTCALRIVRALAAEAFTT